jgi:hypothetical protein
MDNRTRINSQDSIVETENLQPNKPETIKTEKNSLLSIQYQQESYKMFNMLLMP